jgi:hypothetical protein
MRPISDPFDSASDLGLHVAARTVLERCPEPTNELEVAVVLETCGYTASRAALLGASSVLGLGRQVLALMPLYGQSMGDPQTSPPTRPRHRSRLLAFARGVGACSPLLVGLSTTLAAGISFWSSAVALGTVAVAINLSSAVSLIVTAPFVQGFGRRAGLYLALDDEGMLAYIHRWTLQLGLVVTALANVVLYLLRNNVLGVGSPSANRLGLAAGIAVGALQVGLASFFVRRAYLTVAAAVTVASLVLVWRVRTAGPYVDPLSLATWQVRVIAVLAALACATSAWGLLRAANTAPGPVWRPRPGALVRAVAPYAGYGFAYFILIVGPQLVAGGLWQGRYNFDSTFAFAAGTGIIALLPPLALGVTTSEELLDVVIPAALSRRRVAEIGEFRRQLRRYWRRRLTVATVLSATAVGVLLGVVPSIGGSLAGGLAANHFALRAACAVAMAALGLGSLASQLLLSLSQPRLPLASAATGAAVFVVVSALASVWWSAESAGAAGLTLGAAAFAAYATAGADRAFCRADLTYYRTM